MSRRRPAGPALVATLAGAVVCVLAVGRALAHGGSLAGGAGRALTVPLWLFLATGGGVVGASFLLASFATDRAFLASLHGARATLPAPPAGWVARVLESGARIAGLAGLLGVVFVGFLGPTTATRNLAVLLVWVGWWAGLAMAAYLVGNAWPALNPWRTAARALPTLNRSLPDWGRWPAVGGLLGLVWLEVVSPLADEPRLLAGVVLGYSLVTLAGTVAVGEGWFERVDPVSRVFAAYGRVAPVGREGGRLRLRLPGAALTEPLDDRPGSVAFVVALLWATTYDGLVATPAWRAFATALVGAGVPAVVLYPAALLSGFVAFLALYRVAVRYGRRVADTYRSEDDLARAFAPPLLAIAAGYHLAHYLGYFLSLLPALAGALAAPLSPGPAVALVLPGWFGGVALVAVVAGHLLAIWTAHGVALSLFPGRLQAMRSQYALTLAMVCYTMTSLWVVSRPYAPPPFV